MIEVVLSLHLAVATVAYGVAAGYSLAHRYWPGFVVGLAAIANAYILVFYGVQALSMFLRQPVTIAMAYFIVQAADRRGATT